MAGVLIVEPDARLAATYVSALEARGYRARSVTTAQDAILAADEATPDMVLLELQLVTHGGVEFLYEFRSYADWRDVPVVAVSHIPPAEFAASSRLLQERLGVRAYHYKPYLTLAGLIGAVEAALADGAARGIAAGLVTPVGLMMEPGPA